MAIPPPPPPQGVNAGNAGNAPPTQKTSEIIAHLRPTKQFKFSTPTTTATSLSFDDSGEFLLAALSDDSLQLYNVREGVADKTLLSKKYGCHLARFTHHSASIVYASTKADDGIRYLSTHDNQYLRYFRGHTASVTSLNLCPGNDTFISSSAGDNTVRLWNLASPNPHGKLSLACPALTAYDPTATVIAIASPATSSILLYDVRNYDRMPFATFDLSTLDTSVPHIARSLTSASSSGTGSGGGHPQDWTSLTFSNDGKCIILGTNSSLGHIVLDAFAGNAKAFLLRHSSALPLNPARQRAAPWTPKPVPATQALGSGDITVTPDGNFVLGSSGLERDIVVWDISGAKGRQSFEDAEVLAPMAGLPWKSAQGVVCFNPRWNMCATAEREVVLWLPDEFVGRRVGDE